MNSKMKRKLADGFLRMGLVLGGFLSIQPVMGATQGDLVLQDPLGGKDFNSILNSVINFMIYIAIPLCTIMVLVGAFKLVTSSGDPEKTKSGRNTILYAAGGFAVILLAKGITGFIQALFTK
jgi:hypothetical protein